MMKEEIHRLKKSALKNMYPCHSTATQVVTGLNSLTITRISTHDFPWDKGYCKLSVTWFARTLWNCFINKRGKLYTVLCYCNKAFKQILSDLIGLSHKAVILSGLKIYGQIWLEQWPLAALFSTKGYITFWFIAFWLLCFYFFRTDL